jgi:DNA-binding transcriptional ArsR family regulator
MSLLPSSPELSTDSTPRVVDLDSEAADDLMAALSSETARRILATLHEEPVPPGELADRVDTSLQNAQYHREQLEAAGAIEVVGTAYSQKGREMSVYGPADSPLVIAAGEPERISTLRDALSRLFAGFLALAVGGVVVQALFGENPFADGTSKSASGDGDVGTFGADGQSQPTAEDAGGEAADGIVGLLEALFSGGMPPGVAFFLGGALVLTVVVGLLYLRRR